MREMWREVLRTGVVLSSEGRKILRLIRTPEHGKFLDISKAKVREWGVLG